MNRTITAMFDTRAEAEEGATQLRALGAQNVRLHAAPGQDMEPEADQGILASIANLFMPDDDRATYGEGVRRGSLVVSAEITEGQLDSAMDLLENAGAVDLDTRAEEWRGAGWAGGSAAGAAGTSLTGTGPTGTDPGETTPLSGGLAAPADSGTRGANLGSAGTGPGDAPARRGRVRSYVTDAEEGSAANDAQRNRDKGVA